MYAVPDLPGDGIHRCEETIRRSRFIVTLAHASSIDAARSFVESIRQEFPDATHNCWAFAAGPPGDRTEQPDAPCWPCSCTVPSASLRRW